MSNIQSDLSIPDAMADMLVYRMPENLKFLYQENTPDAPYYA